MAMALACDQTRVLSYTYNKPLNNILFPHSSDGHHTLTHNEPGDQPEVQEITRFCMPEAAVFLDALNAIPEGSGTLLDNCGIVLSSEVSEGRTHSTTEHPLLIAGGAGGRLKMGIHYRSYAKENLNSATLSVMRALGSDIASLGDGNTFTSDGLSAIEN